MVKNKASSLNNIVLSIRINKTILVTLVWFNTEKNFGVEKALEVIDMVILVVDLGTLVAILVAKVEEEDDNPKILIKCSADCVVEGTMLKCNVIISLISCLRIHLLLKVPILQTLGHIIQWQQCLLL